MFLFPSARKPSYVTCEFSVNNDNDNDNENNNDNSIF